VSTQGREDFSATLRISLAEEIAALCTRGHLRGINFGHRTQFKCGCVRMAEFSLPALWGLLGLNSGSNATSADADICVNTTLQVRGMILGFHQASKPWDLTL